MSDDEIKITLEGAFRPFSCVAQLDDYDEKLNLLVTDRETHVLLKVKSCPLNLLRDESGLNNFLVACRTDIATGLCAELRAEVDTFRLGTEADEDLMGLQAVCRSLKARLDELGNRWIKEFGQPMDHSEFEGPVHECLSSLREDLDAAATKLRDKLSKN